MIIGKTKLPRITACIFTLLTFSFLYVPLVVLIIFSFNTNKFPGNWDAFTLKWYKELFCSQKLWSSFFTSLTVSLISAFMSLFMGILLLYFKIHGGNIRKTIPLFYANLLIPESLVAISLLSFFSFFEIPLGLTTLIIAHTVLGLGFTIPILYSRFKQFDKRQMEASLSLGATTKQTFYRIVLPFMKPAILAASLLVFILSFDDFILSYFTAGTNVETLSLYLLSMLRTGISPIVNALSAFILILSCLLVMFFYSPKIRSKVF